jgi:iron complex outermembrane receptor protein
MYIDDVYYGVMTGSVFGLLDTDRVEVLRGPQGTLAGKNSIGGSVKLFTKLPGEETDGYAEVTSGGRKLVGLRAAGNITLLPGKLYLRVSGAGRRADGYVDRLDYNCVTGSTTVDTFHFNPGCKLGTQGGEDVFTARATLRWLIATGIEDIFSFDTTQDSSENPASKQIFQSPLWAGTENFITPAHSYTNYDNNISTPTGPGAGPAFERPDKTPLDATGVTNRLHWNFSDTLHLDSITGYRKSTVQFSTPSEATPFTVSDQIWRLAHKQFTQELRLSGEIPHLVDWTVGAFYYDADGVSSLRVNLPGGLVVGGGGLNLDLFARDPVKTKSKSVFAHSVWHVGDKFNVTAAVRYTDDEKSYTFNRWDRFGNPHPALPGLLDLTRTYKGKRTDYRAGLDYKWTDNLLTYVQVSTGYKGGGVSPRPYYPSQAIPYNPETLTAYEAGIKTQALDRRLSVNAAVFLNKYKDFQGLIFSCPAFTPNNAPAPCAMTTNTGDADIKGVELEVMAEPIEGLRLDLSAGKLDFKFKRVNPFSGVQLGFKNVYSPDFNLNLGAQYEFGAGSHGSLTPRLDYSYHSDFYTSIINTDPENKIDAQGLLNARLTWKGPGNDWEAALIVTNLADSFYYVSKYAATTAPYFSGTGRPGEPRQWAITVKRRV